MYMENSDGDKAKGRSRDANYGREKWRFGVIRDITDTSTEESANVVCRGEETPYDWCPHRFHYCYPSLDPYDGDDLATAKNPAAAGAKSIKIYDTLQAYAIHISEEDMSFQEAKEYCSSLGLKLIRPQSPSETSDFVKVVNEHFGGVDFWIAISDENDISNWTDIYTGRELRYWDNWADGEPTNNQTNHHAQFKTSSEGTWTSADGTTASGARAGCLRGFTRAS